MNTLLHIFQNKLCHLQSILGSQAALYPPTKSIRFERPMPSNVQGSLLQHHNSMIFVLDAEELILWWLWAVPTFRKINSTTHCAMPWLFNIIQRDPIPPPQTIPRNGVQEGLMPRKNNHLNECIHVQIQILSVMGVFQICNLGYASFKFQPSLQQPHQS